MKFLRRLFFLCLLTACSFGGWKYQDQLIAFYHQHLKQSDTAKAKPDPERYQELKSSLARTRRNLEARYATARTPQELKNVMNEARSVLESEMPKMMRCWLGTPWAFHGTSQTPGSGEIACGYYVSTILRDAGFQIERVRLAQQPSQNILGTFLPREQMHIRSGKPYDDFLAEVVSRGPGIRIVGLDTHVAFLVINAQEGVRFIHSSRSSEKSVVDENRQNAHALRASRYRVSGNVTASDQVIHHWLTKTPFPTKT